MYRNRFNPRKKFNKRPRQKSLANYELMKAIRSVEVIKKEVVTKEEHKSAGNFDSIFLFSLSIGRNTSVFTV